MLQRLTIQNYLLIDNLEISFSDGLSIITGETGAGKSIMIGALSLLLGQRADRTVLRDQESKCVVEALFSIAEYKLQKLFELLDVDYEEQTIIRREIHPNGKSRAFINDSPVDLTALKEIGTSLIDIHSQHQSLNLTDNSFQLKVVDAVAGNDNLLQEYAQVYSAYKSLSAQYSALAEEIQKTRSDYEYYLFQCRQLQEARLTDGEQEQLEQELHEQEHAEEIKGGLAKSFNLISGEGVGILAVLKEVKDTLAKISSFFSKTQTLHERLQSSYLEIKDVANEIESICEKVEHDPQRMEQTKQRLDLIYELQQKHRVSSVLALLNIQQELEKKIQHVSTSDEKLQALASAVGEHKQRLEELSENLRNRRKEVFNDIQQKVVSVLKQLAIVNASLVIHHEVLNDFTPSGKDKVRFLFSANKNEEVQDIAKVASGGEISRLMLSIKYLIAQRQALPTIIFDEIDTGISSDIADKMGSILKTMASKTQVLNITHLPQIAAKGDHHFYVYKQDGKQKTYTYIKKLEEKERIVEIAKMLSGEELTDAALSNAKALLQIKN